MSMISEIDGKQWDLFTADMYRVPVAVRPVSPITRCYQCYREVEPMITMKGNGRIVNLCSELCAHRFHEWELAYKIIKEYNAIVRLNIKFQ